MDNPRIFVGLTNSFVQEKIQNGTVINYLSDPSTAFIMTTKGETSLGLSKVKVKAQVSVGRPPEVHTGIVESFNDETAHILSISGTEVVTKYEKIVFPQHVESDDSFIVNFPTESEPDEPVLHYLTESITWSPSLVLDFQTKTLSMAAVIKSSRRNNYTSDFTVVLTSTRSTSHPIKGAEMMRATASSSTEEVATTHPLIYKIGPMTISDTFRFPLKSSPVSLVLRNFIEISRWDGNTEGSAESGFLFDNPFYFPAGTLLVRQNHINTVSEIKSHQEHEPVAVKTYLSDKIRYKSFVSDVEMADVSITTGSKKHQLTLRILVDKSADRPENVTIVFNVGDLGQYEVTPKPTERIQKPGKISWNVTASAPSEHFEAIIIYQN